MVYAGPEADDVAGLGLSPDEMRRWEPFYPLEVYWARKHRLGVDTARSWAAEGIAVRDTVRAVALGLSRDDLRPWLAAGFLPSDGIEATEAGVSLDTAMAWREVGFILPDALLLLEEGWTLESATAARYADIGRHTPVVTGDSASKEVPA